MPSKNPEHQNNVKKQTHTIYAFTDMISSNILHLYSSFRPCGVTFCFLFKHAMHWIALLTSSSSRTISGLSHAQATCIDVQKSSS